MNRVSAFIDGFNFYHALANEHHRQFKWINLRKLVEAFLQKQDHLSDVFYFTALAIWSPDKVARHKIYIKALESCGVKTIFGKFRSVAKRCRVCGKQYETHEEKETDVNIAIELYRQASKDTYDTAIILSGDSDQVPAVRAIKKCYPNKKVGVLIPPDRRAKILKQTTDFHSKITQKQLYTSMLPNTITLPNGTQISCPSEWN